MTKKLATELAKMEDWEFFLLEHHIQFARMVRDTISKNAIHINEMANQLNVDPKSMKAIINGAHEIDLRTVSRLQSLQQKIASENAKLKVEAESIGFYQYKDQYPAFVERINKLLAVLEKSNG